MDEDVRMQAQMYALVAEMHAIVADIEKMKADNKVAEMRDEYPPWTGSEFAEMGKGLTGIARALRDSF